MLTRIEIDGFKTFEEFALDLDPFMVVLGPNASGKSNLFDAIRLIGRLADRDLRAAFTGLRGEPHELFRRQPDGEPGSRMRFAVELLLNRQVRDLFGGTAEVKYPRIRYEVELVQRFNEFKGEQLLVIQESATPIRKSGDRWANRPSVSSAFRDAFLRYNRRTPWLETVRATGGAAAMLERDAGKLVIRTFAAAETTFLSTIASTTEFPHLFALREELRSWRFLQLSPAALRQPGAFLDKDQLKPDGSNLARVLARLQAETKTEKQPKGVLAEVAADLVRLIPGVVGLSVDADEANREYRVSIATRDGPPFSARVVSDGTLRTLALLSILHDPTHRGLVCMEELENGVHPLRLRRMIELIQEHVTDPSGKEVYPEEPLSQFLLNSHSPVVLSCRNERTQMMFADLVDVVTPGSELVRRRTRLRPIRSSPAAQGADRERAYVTENEVERYLAAADRGA